MAFEMVTHPEKCSGCLVCQLQCSFRFTRSFNPSQAAISIRGVGRGMGAEISFTDRCDGCGLCARFCPYEALETRRKAKVSAL